MIKVRLLGGLGNNLFQYAAARALALRNGGHVYLDRQLYAKEFRYIDVLDKLNLSCSSISSLNDICFGACDFVRRVMRHRPSYLWRYICNEIDYYNAPEYTLKNDRDLLVGNVAIERTFSYDDTFFSLPMPVALVGFWQSEKYFAHIREHLLGEICLKQPSREYMQLAAKIVQNNSVSLHCRRGDKVDNVYHPSTTDADVFTCINYIESMLDDSFFFVFSDDIEWSKQVLCGKKNVYFVESIQPHNYHEELFLMSICKHNIVAPSSFSWWGAWLNVNSNKLVVTVNKEIQIGIQMHDYWPRDWVVLG